MDKNRISPGNREMGLYRPEFEHDNCGIGAIVNIKGIKTHGRLLKNWNTEQAKMPKDEQVTESELCFRYRINSSQESVSPSAFF